MARPRRIITVLAGFAAAIMGLIGVGLSYELFPSNLPSGVYRRIFPVDLPVHLVVDHEGLPTVADADGGVTAAIGAALEWNGGPAGTLVTAQAGAVSENLVDGISEVIFTPGSGACDDPFCYAATGWTFFDPQQEGCWTQKSLSMSRILEANVYFNPQQNWSSLAEVCSFESYVEYYTRHEVGHVLGLAHAPGFVVMTGQPISDCWNLTLQPDDLAGRDAIYTAAFDALGACTPDDDADHWAEPADNCPGVANQQSRGGVQSDMDRDRLGDGCDNCPTMFNPSQQDTDHDTYGDLCDICPFFVSLGPRVEVRYPRGGETLYVGSEVTIEWITCRLLDATFTIQINRGGPGWQTIAVDYVGQSIPWTVTGPLGEENYVRVVATPDEGMAMMDISDASFRVNKRGGVHGVNACSDCRRCVCDVVSP